MKQILLFLAVVFTFLLVSCDKDNYIEPSDSVSPKNSTSIPTFSDFDELHAEIKMINEFTSLEEIRDYEMSQGRESIGTKSDAFYESIDPNTFNSAQEMLNFFEANSNILDTIMESGEITILPKYFFSQFRHVANEDGLFIVDTCVFKIFKLGLVSTSLSNLYLLLSQNESNYGNLDTSVFKYVTTQYMPQASHAGCLDDNFSDWYFQNTLSSGSDCVSVVLSTQRNARRNLYDYIDTYVYVYSRHKTLGIWWVSKHTHSCSGNVKCHIKESADEWEIYTKNINTSKLGRKLSIFIYSMPSNSSTDTDVFHYYSFDIKAKTPDLAYATLTHNQ